MKRSTLGVWGVLVAACGARVEPAERPAAPDVVAVDRVESGAPDASEDALTDAGEVLADVVHEEVVPAPDASVSDCAEAAGTNLGCDFWATCTANSVSPAALSFGITVTNSTERTAVVRVEGGALDAPLLRTLAPRSSEAILLPWILALSGQDTVRCVDGSMFAQRPTARVASGGYRITSNVPVGVVQYNPIQWRPPMSSCHPATSADASLLWPTRALGTRYVLATVANTPFGENIAHGFVTVVGAGPEGHVTRVRIDSSAQYMTPDSPGVATGATEFSLRRGEVVQLATARGTFTGATLDADAPVAVFVGQDCVQVPHGLPACDHVEEQLLPEASWGREYIVALVRDRPAIQEALIKIVAGGAPVDLAFDGIAAPAGCQSTLPARGSCEFFSNVGFAVRGSARMMVQQYLPSFGGAGSIGDPSLLTKTAREQLMPGFAFHVVGPGAQSYLGVIAPRGTALALDGAPVRAAGLPTGGAFETTTIPVPQGYHEVRAVDGVTRIGAELFGAGTVFGYATQAGAALPR